MGYYRIVRDENKNYDRTDLVKEHFLRRDFVNVETELEKGEIDNERYTKDALEINRALVNHILGKYDMADSIYKELLNNEMCYINYLACCHRYFDYKKVVQNNENRIPYKYQLAYDNNHFNYLIATTGIEILKNCDIPSSIFTEQIINDLYVKIGKDMLHEQNDIIKEQYLKSVDILEKKFIINIKKKVGIFVTDIQRHKDAAIIYELVECLKDKFEIVIYFNNIFANKLAKCFEEICEVRHVINLYFEEINNLIFDDEIDVLIDLAEYGLRNNNIALSLIQNCIPLHELLNMFPILLHTNNYYTGELSEVKEDCTCVIGDMRCLSDDELMSIKEQIVGKILFESHSLDEEVFKKNFEKRLINLGFDMNRVDILAGILPFSKYMKFLSSCRNVIISSGASYVELSEAIKSKANIGIMSANRLIKKTYDLYYLDQNNEITNMDCIVKQDEILKKKLCQYILAYSSSKLYKVRNRKSRIAYFEQDKEICISNTCNGDIVLLGES